MRDCPYFLARNRHAIGAVAHIRRYISGLIYLSGYFLGCAHMKLDQYQKAIDAFQKAVAQKSNCAEAFNDLESCFFIVGFDLKK